MKSSIFLLSIFLFADVGLLSVSGEPVQYIVEENNVTCIMASFSGHIIDSVKNKTYEITGKVSKNESSCGESEQVLYIGNEKDGYDLVFEFSKANSSVILSSVTFKLADVLYVNNSKLYSVPQGNSFKCDSGITGDLKNSGVTFQMQLKSVRFDAFRKANSKDFESDSVCANDSSGSNKTVPMIIAFVLAGMVVIMLVGYIILRKREDKSTYQTV